MEVLLNGKLFSVKQFKSKSFKDLYQNIQTDLYNNGLIIQTLKLNNKEINFLNITNYELDNIEKIDIEAENINIIVIKTLSEMNIYINRFSNAIEGLYGKVSIEEPEKYIPVFQKIISGLSWIFIGIKNCEISIGESYSKIVFNGKSLQFQLQEHEDLLNNIKTSLVSNNYAVILENLFTILPNLLNSINEIIKLLLDVYKKNHFTIEELQLCINYFKIEFYKRPQIYDSIFNNIQEGNTSKSIHILQKEILFFEEWIVFLKTLEKTYCNINSHIHIYEKTIFDYNKSFMEKLRKVSEAFENEELNSVINIIEFELYEYIEIFLKYLKIINDEILENNN